jgi:hypothetical protein
MFLLLFLISLFVMFCKPKCVYDLRKFIRCSVPLPGTATCVPMLFFKTNMRTNIVLQLMPTLLYCDILTLIKALYNVLLKAFKFRRKLL